MAFTALPTAAAWRHIEARDGFEVAFFEPTALGIRITGCTTAVENHTAWAVDYDITVDAAWVTRTARVTLRSAAGMRSVRLDADGAGRWWVDGAPAPALDGCRDVDLEASAMTNALPVHRLELPVGGKAAPPAAWVRVTGAVERLEQTYHRRPDAADQQRYDYAAPALGFNARLEFDPSGLVLRYPGIAVRTR